MSTPRPPLTNKQKFLLKLERFDNETLTVKQNPFYTEILGPNLESAVQHVDTLHPRQYLGSKAKVGWYFVPQYQVLLTAARRGHHRGQLVGSHPGQPHPVGQVRLGGRQTRHRAPRK